MSSFDDVTKREMEYKVTKLCGSSNIAYYDLTAIEYRIFSEKVFFRMCLNQGLYLDTFSFYPTGRIGETGFSIFFDWYVSSFSPHIFNKPNAVLQCIFIMGDLGIVSESLEKYMISRLCNSLLLDIDLDGFENIDWTIANE